MEDLYGPPPAFDTLEGLVAAMLALPPDAVSDATARSETEQWSSLGHLTIVTAIEETYSITLTTDEIRQAETVGDLRRLLQSRGVDV